MSGARRPRGTELLEDAALNKSTAFTRQERERLGLRGLLPAAVCDQRTQISRALGHLERKADDIERYIFLRGLEARNERLFYRLLEEHPERIMPLVYTPTVGEACKEFAHIFRRPEGFYLTPRDRGEMHGVLENWPADDVRVIVVTDGERILGLGDLGANGMGIPIGKLSLYTACAGIAPEHCLPVMLDVGTDNIELREDELYLGIPEGRLRGGAYTELVDEFVDAVTRRFPDVLIQFEDFATPNALSLLDRYRDRTLCFNDDIQGTAAVVLAGIHAYTRIVEDELRDLRVVFLGAGSANTGVASLLATALQNAGLAEGEALDRLWMVDRQGLITQDREDLPDHLAPFASDRDPVDFLGTLRAARPQLLVGATGSAGSFTRETVELMAELNERPGLFALSNPTDHAECTAEQAYSWTDGRAVFASGSPFDPVEVGDHRLVPGQANNVYVFPGIGQGAILARATCLPDSAFLAAARALADCVDEAGLANGTLYPPLGRIRDVSLRVAEAVADCLFDEGLARSRRPDDLAAALLAERYETSY